MLHQLAVNRVVPREEGIEGWLWTNLEGSAFLTLGDEAPNVAFVFSPPIAAERLEGVLSDDMMAEVAKRSPLGQPALFGLLLRAEDHDQLDAGLRALRLPHGAHRPRGAADPAPAPARRQAGQPEPGRHRSRDRGETSVAPPGVR